MEKEKQLYKTGFDEKGDTEYQFVEIVHPISLGFKIAFGMFLFSLLAGLFSLIIWIFILVRIFR